MTTEAELRAQIEAAQRELEAQTARRIQSSEMIEQASRRQELRRQLDAINLKINSEVRRTRVHEDFASMIDRDIGGIHLPSERPNHLRNSQPHVSPSGLASGSEVQNCNKAVAKGQYIWKIEGFSWLTNALQQMDEFETESKEFVVGGEPFVFVYSPTRGVVSRRGPQLRGSLAIIHLGVDGITFRYKISIKQAGGDFVQWGELANECHPHDNTDGRAFGPDVQKTPGVQREPCGIFGLSHAELLRSEWVENDALTVQFELEVRADVGIDCLPLRTKNKIDIPTATLSKNLLAMLEDGKGADVTFIVEGEPLEAHSQILAARSEVLDRQLNGSMRESVSKEIVVEDCDIPTFKALLNFIYTDDFSCMEEVLTNACASATARAGGTDSSTAGITVAVVRTSLLQNILAVSHKYELTRLRLWCEQHLCDSVGVGEVCSLLCDANLYGAKRLEAACLTFMKEHMEQVVVTTMFGNLVRDWPEVMLKIQLFNAGIPESKAAAAIDVQRRGSGVKRKRDE